MLPLLTCGYNDKVLSYQLLPFRSFRGLRSISQVLAFSLQLATAHVPHPSWFGIESAFNPTGDLENLFGNVIVSRYRSRWIIEILLGPARWAIHVTKGGAGFFGGQIMSTSCWYVMFHLLFGMMSSIWSTAASMLLVWLACSSIFLEPSDSKTRIAKRKYDILLPDQDTLQDRRTDSR